jgi:hypothetical protein
LEGIAGDYVEFGLFEGNSLIAAVNSYEAQDLSRYVEGERARRSPCRFFGFDSFEGFNPDPCQDAPHPVFSRDNFSTPHEKVLRRLKRYKRSHEITLVKGFFSETCTLENLVRLGINNIRVCLIDCDLGSSTRDTLRHSPKFWQPGTVVILDDYFSYPAGGGEFSAFAEFCEAHHEFKFRDYGHYGLGGRAFMVETPPRIDRD